MRVVHWYANFAGGGGVANSVETLARAQAEAGAEVTIAFATARGARLYGPVRGDGAVALHEWRPLWTLSLGGLTLRGLRPADARALRALEPDVVHVHGEFLPDNLRVPRLFDAPLVLSPHGAFHPLVLAKSNATAKRVYAAFARRVLYRHALLHALSPAAAADIHRVVPGADVYCAPQAAEPHLPAPALARADDGALLLLFVGRLDVYTKGLDVLLDALAETRRRGVDARLTLAGPDWAGGRGVLERRARELALDGAVRFTGAVGRTEALRLLSEADAYVQLSRHEGAPLAVADALAAGKPLVLSAAVGTASHPEVRALGHVQIVEPAAAPAAGALAALAASLPRQRAAAEASRPAVARFLAPAAVAQAHLEQYERLVRARRRESPAVGAAPEAAA